MRPKSVCMRYFFVNALMHSTNVCFYVVCQHLTKKQARVCAIFFVNALMHSTNNAFFMQCASAFTKNIFTHKLYKFKRVQRLPVQLHPN